MSQRNRILGYFDNWTTFEKVWLFTFTAVGIGLSLYWESSIISMAAMVTGMVTVVLVARRDITNYAFGVVNAVLYGWVAYQSQFYGEVMLNWLFYLPVQGIGFYFWKKNIEGSLVEVKSFTNRQRISIYAGSIISIGGYGLILKVINGNLPFFDATSTVLSVVAMLLMVARSKDQWILWIVINCVSIYMWLTTFLNEGTGIAMVVMWSSYLVNSLYGYYNWNKMEA
jgi:nicotinamide mononucleotide transporter